MAWYSDEEYEFRCDSRDKKRTAASAHKQRSHCGKGGRVKFPSDYMTKKEKEKMNGECVTYKINKYVTKAEYETYPDDIKVQCDKKIDEIIQVRVGWEEFKSWGDYVQCRYVTRLRELFQAPNTAISDMFGVGQAHFSRYLCERGMGVGKHNGNARRKWDKDGFEHWAYPTKFLKTAEQIAAEQAAKAEAEAEEIPVFAPSEPVCEAPEAPVSDVCDSVEDVVEDAVEPVEIVWKIAPEEWAPVDVDNSAVWPIETPASVDPKEALDILDKLNEAIDELNRANEEVPVKTAVPKAGMLTFECCADDALNTIRGILQGVNVKLKVEWEVA